MDLFDLGLYEPVGIKLRNNKDTERNVSEVTEEGSKRRKTRSEAPKGTGARKSPKTHPKTVKDALDGITNPAIRRLARRAGVTRISKLVYPEIRGNAEAFLEQILRDAVTFTEHARRKTVSPLDVVYALKRNNRTMYGFGG